MAPPTTSSPHLQQMLPPPPPVSQLSQPPSHLDDASHSQPQSHHQSHSPTPISTPTPSPSPSQLPQGQCRFILLLPELKGQRCACVCFSRDKSLPGATCDCGHMSCYHLPSANAASPGMNRDQIEAVKQRVNVLEQQSGLGADLGDLGNVIPRLSQLEETADRNREELQNEIKGSYRSISAAWQMIEQFQRRMAAFEETYRIQSEQLARAGMELNDLRNRNLELLETDEMLEERIEKLEGMETLLSPALDPVPKGFVAEPPPIDLSSSVLRRRRSSASRPFSPPSTTETGVQIQPDEARSVRTQAAMPSSPWTVHISFVPSRRQPFPFKKDTNAYKRCLSRGLHQMVAVDGTDGPSFAAAVNRAFQDVLQGASWEPLQVRSCDARGLRGMPGLLHLDQEDAHGNYDVEFLRSRCAVCDGDGMQSIYLAPQQDVLTWSRMKQLPVYVKGLESAWEYDSDLDDLEKDTDMTCTETRGRQDCSLPVTPPSGYSLKRGASEMQTTALATGGLIPSESDGHLAKKSRNLPGMIQIR